MIECTSTGAYLARGQWVPADGHAPEALAALGFDAAAAAQAKKGTIAWGILQAHNTSGDEENLKIKFDAMASHDITDSLIEENYFPILPISLGLTVTGEGSGGTVTELLTTSDAAFSKAAGYSLSTYDKEDGDIDGPFSLAVSVEYGDGGGIVWFSSSSYLNDLYNAYSSGSNGDLAMNALSDLIGEREAMAIRSKSLNYNYLTISASTSALLQTVMIGVCPLLFLGVGIAVILRRRRNQNEPC